MDNVRDLDLLVATHQPIIAIESPEEDRVRAIVEGLAARQDLPLFEWKATRGLLRIGTREPLYETEKPSQALKTAAGMECEALYLFHDLQI
ncbi:MAG TPA: hypothetical protein VJ144_02570, partial [Candidatus Polarisedimenticolia bacterium]|nr:hypothetical protein [Candidatus Polarisedimenticolia bacterium]